MKKALFALRGNRADNNDYLARQIIALAYHRQDTSALVAKLLLRASAPDAGGAIIGWSMGIGYKPDPLDTVLALQAVWMGAPSNFPLSSLNTAFEQLRSSALFQSKDGPYHYGWLGRTHPDSSNYLPDTSLYVSAFVHGQVNISLHATPATVNSNWIIDSQITTGAYGNGVVDTAGVFLRKDYLGYPNTASFPTTSIQ